MASAGVLVFSCLSARASATIADYFGSVRVLEAGTQNWVKVEQAPAVLNVGDELSTGFLARATVIFKDGSKVQLGGSSTFTLDVTKPGLALMSLLLGVLRAEVTHNPARSFQVRTPTSVCAVRGTHFKIQVLAGGTTLVHLYRGLLAVTDRKGQQLLLHPNEGTRVGLKGLPRLGGLPGRSAARMAAARFHARMKREMNFEISRGQIQAQAEKELRLADYQQGKTLIDVSGHVVRVEQYIMQPSPDQVKMVVLDERQNSLNYFYYLGTFNTTLPPDISVALRELPGTPDAPPQYYLTGYHSYWSNGTDSLQEITSGGHLVNLNNNSSGDASEAVTSYFDPLTNSYKTLTSGEAFYSTLFDNEGLYVDGNLKSGWSGSGIETYHTGYGSYSPTAATTSDPITGASLTTALPLVTTNVTFPDPGQIHQTVYNSYGDGTFLKFDNYIINNDGLIASNSAFGSTSGTSFTQNLLNYNFEQIITASEFQGRSIDLVVSPKIFVQSGLIQ
ncbi:MAG TPA: FecR family protein [Elusimicrobiota bacterium]|nr:FecR family protein [Elusimicrobiota bacterium]